VPVSSIAKDNEGNRHGELIHDNVSKVTDATEDATPDTAAHCCGTAASDTYHTTSAMSDTSDDTVITPKQLQAKKNEYDNINETQRNQLLSALTKYQRHLLKSNTC
jgi:hypothetical protein